MAVFAVIPALIKGVSIATRLASIVGRAATILGRGKNIKYLGKVLRSKSSFRSIYDRSKLKSILDFNDIVDLVNRDKKMKNFVLDNLFNLTGSNRFIFESEEELKTFVSLRDRSAKICKILELEEVDLYLVEGSIFTQEGNSMLNYVASAMFIGAFQQFYNNVIMFINTFYSVYSNLIDQVFQEIDNKLSEEKENDIDNTYCIRCSCSCSCSCSCEEGSCSCSCSCSCDCNLVHYTQSWENLRSCINEKKDYLKEQLYLKTVCKDSEESLLFLFMGAYQVLQSIFRTQIKEKYLFVVLKKDNIVKLFQNKLKEKKKKVTRLIYEYLKSNRYKKFEYDKLIRDLQKYLREEMNKEYTKKQIMVLINTVIKRYNLRKETLRINNKTYIYIL